MGRIKAERKEYMVCTKCDENKHISEFLNNAEVHLQCKKCLNEAKYESKERNVKRVTDEIVVMKIINQKETDAAVCLYESCISSVSRCRYDESYKDISNVWDSENRIIETVAKEMMLDLIERGQNYFWSDWKEQHKVFRKTQNQHDRATINRIDSSKDYSLSNINMLSYIDNVLDAAENRKKLTRVMVVDRQTLETLRFQDFESVTDAIKYLQVKYKINRSVVDRIKNDGNFELLRSRFSVIIQTIDGEITRKHEQPIEMIMEDYKGNKVSWKLPYLDLYGVTPVPASLNN